MKQVLTIFITKKCTSYSYSRNKKNKYSASRITLYITWWIVNLLILTNYLAPLKKKWWRIKISKKKNVYFRFTIIQVGKRKHMYRHLYMHPTKKGKPQITDMGSGEVDWITDIGYHKFVPCVSSNFLNFVQLIIR